MAFTVYRLFYKSTLLGVSLFCSSVYAQRMSQDYAISEVISLVSKAKGPGSNPSLVLQGLTNLVQATSCYVGRTAR